jgi:hypothetical protein
MQKLDVGIKRLSLTALLLAEATVMTERDLNRGVSIFFVRFGQDTLLGRWVACDIYGDIIAAAPCRSKLIAACEAKNVIVKEYECEVDL